VSEDGAVEALRERVDRYLDETGLEHSVDDAGDYMIPFGTAVTWVRPMAWKEGRTLVRVWSITNVDLPITPELTRFLVTTNAQLAFGGLHLDPRRPSVIMAHSLLGDYLNRAELQVAIAGVAGTADRFAPEIKQRFGGKLFTEA
jgi:hypothetical protein